MVKKKDLDVDFGFDLEKASVNVPHKSTETNIESSPNIIDKEEKEIIKRLTLDIPLSLHKKFKMLAMEENTTMANILRTWIMEHTK